MFYGPSPILEISQEWGGASFATFPLNSTERLKKPEISRAAETPEEGGNKAHALQFIHSVSLSAAAESDLPAGFLPFLTSPVVFVATRWRCSQTF